MKKLLLVLMMVLMASVSFGTAVGVKGGYSAYTGDMSDMSGLAFGADVQFSMGPLVIAPEILYSSTSHADSSAFKVNDLAFNVNALFKVPVIGIYGGAGLGYHSITLEFIGSETTGKLGGQIIAGYQIDLPAIKPFIEARYVKIFDEEFSDPRFDLLVGVNLGF